MNMRKHRRIQTARWAKNAGPCVVHRKAVRTLVKLGVNPCVPPGSWEPNRSRRKLRKLRRIESGKRKIMSTRKLRKLRGGR